MNDKGRQATSESSGLAPHLPVFVFVHDLRQPLRAIVAALQRTLQQPGDFPAGTREQLAMALQFAFGQGELMAAALEYESARAGETLEPREVPLFMAIDAACLKLEPMRKTSGANIRLPSGPVRHPVPAVLTRVLEKVLHNALKFHAPGTSPEVNVETRSGPNSGFEVRITDNGIGIDARYRQKVFEPFGRLNSSASYPGSGLGLAICRTLLASNGGSIDIEDREDRASGITVVLKVAASSHPSS